VVKKVEKKAKASPKKVSQELVIRVAPQDVRLTEQDLIEPMKDGKKMALTKTWVSALQLMQLVGKTPAQFIYERPGKGGGKFKYVMGSYIIKALNFVFGWNWDFEVIAHGIEGGQVWVHGKLTVKSPNGETITKSQFGRADIKYKKDGKGMLDFGNDLKGASTDAMKKCASLLGIASDVYGKTEYKDETGNDPANNHPVDDNQKHPPEGAVVGPDGSPVQVCSKCDEIVDDKVASFSKSVYKKVLCRDCQPKRK